MERLIIHNTSACVVRKFEMAMSALNESKPQESHKVCKNCKPSCRGKKKITRVNSTILPEITFFSGDCQKAFLLFRWGNWKLKTDHIIRNSYFVAFPVTIGRFQRKSKLSGLVATNDWVLTASCIGQVTFDNPTKLRQDVSPCLSRERSHNKGGFTTS